jgi:hypothetical protein
MRQGSWSITEHCGEPAREVVISQEELQALEQKAADDHLRGWIFGFLCGISLIPLGAAIGELVARFVL